MLAMIGRLSADVGRRQPVAIRKASLVAVSIRWVWVLRHQTGAQYSALERAWIRVTVRNVVSPAPKPESASYLESATRDVNFLRSDSRYRRYVNVLSNVTPRYLDSEEKGWCLIIAMMKTSYKSLLHHETRKCRMIYVFVVKINVTGEMECKTSN